MKKVIIILTLLSMALCLVAQQGQLGQQGQQNQQIKQNEKIKKSEKLIKTKKKMNYELEYNNLNDQYKKLQAQERERHMKWQELDKKHKALVKNSNTNNSEVEALKKANTMMQAERKKLKEENAKLKAELKKLKPPKKKPLKKVIEG